MRISSMVLGAGAAILALAAGILVGVHRAFALVLDLVKRLPHSSNNLIDKVKAKHKVIKGLSFSINVGIFALNIDL